MPNPIEELRKHMRRQDVSQEQLAESIGISPPFLSAVLAGKKPVTPRILQFLQLEKRVTYRKAKGAPL
jgi:antitoxin component HigA of HigAB toxin-antitoxin module